MNSLEEFDQAFKELNNKNTKLILLEIITVIFLAFFVDRKLVGIILYEIYMNKKVDTIGTIIAIAIYGVTIIPCLLIFSKHYIKVEKKFLEKVYEGFRTIDIEECKSFNNIMIQDKIGNIVDGKLVVMEVSEFRKLFESYENKTVFGIESLVDNYKLQVFECILSKEIGPSTYIPDGDGGLEELKNTKIYKGMVLVIEAPDNLSSELLMRVIDEYALRKQYGKLTPCKYMNGFYYTNTYKCKNKCIVVFDKLGITNGLRNYCLEGCIVVNEVVSLLRHLV